MNNKRYILAPNDKRTQYWIVDIYPNSEIELVANGFEKLDKIAGCRILNASYDWLKEGTIVSTPPVCPPK